MSLKVGYVIFYVAFISILIFFQFQMGEQIIGIDNEALTVFQETPATGDTLIDSLTFLFNIAVFGITAFAFLIQVAVSPEFIFLNVFLALPLGAGFLWTLLELARGN